MSAFPTPPAPIPATSLEDCEAMMRELHEAAHRVLGCRGVSRTDFRYDDTEGPGAGLYILETNTQPGMPPLSLVPEIAGHEGMSFEALVSWLVEDAGCDR